MGNPIFVRVENLENGRSFERTFERGPVTIGREGPVAAIVLDGDARVSKLHATVDLRAGRLCIRDVRSTNGTLVRGAHIPPNRWVDLHSAENDGEFQIAAWRITTRVTEVPDDQEKTRAFASDPPRESSSPVRPGSSAQASEPAPPPTGDLRQAVDLATQRIEAANARVRAATAQLRDELRAQLASFAPELRRPLAKAVAARVPEILADPACAQALRGAGAPPPTEIAPALPISASAEAASLAALQELSAWYVDRAAPVSSATEVIAFKHKLKSALDELILGFVPLAAGQLRFEQQIALHPHELAELTNLRHPRAPSDFARALLDWRNPSDAPSQSVRETFADLMMHQIGLLNGVLRGVKVLLTELSPETLERVYDASIPTAGLFARLRRNRARELFELYRARFSDLADEENERFRLIFGAEFAAEYKERARETRGQPSASSLHSPREA